MDPARHHDTSSSRGGGHCGPARCFRQIALTVMVVIGRRLVERSAPASQSGYRFSYRVLADPKTINAFALPGGPVFITRALYNRPQRRARGGQLARTLTSVSRRPARARMHAKRATDARAAWR